MESAIVVEGFKQSIQMHNLKYKYFIADGDSSTYKKMCEAKPYGNNFFIEKIECKNQERWLSVKVFGGSSVIYSRGNYLNNILQNISKNATGHYQNLFSQRKIKKWIQEKKNQKKYFKKQSNNKPDKDYGLNAEESVQLSDEEFEAKKQEFLKNLVKNISERTEIFNNTTAQGNSAAWYVERQQRLTSSNFGKICKLREKTDRTKTIEAILNRTFC
ncbi:uncharacterized protein LOC126883127 [Diabrotica virgifera virgifera]|uniref:Mutator-like transposase domain-containing protein n=1 Tax=Diabrotica virgifera virgifera TaxID=50390 RepID=A0ABM5K2B4_DIAVI|nr:uncharacterized protein LOC126883127 [Diabrotica virgifera virgifera]